MSNETQGPAGQHAMAFLGVCLSHKQNGLMLKRMVAKSEESEVRVEFSDLMEILVSPGF